MRSRLSLSDGAMSEIAPITAAASQRVTPRANHVAVETVEAVAKPAAWERSPRYADQPTDLRTRLVGTSGVTGVAVLLAAGALLSWSAFRTHTAQPEPVLALFDVAPPAAPPEPVREVKPGPEQVEQEKPQPRTEQATIAPIPVPTLATQPVAVAKAPSEPAPRQEPPAQETTAPEARPLPPAPTPSNAVPTWQGRVLASLHKVRRYPRDASLRRQQGVPYIRFVMNREGKILSVRLERSSGFRSLDSEALSLPKRAQPLPKPPEDVQGESIELVVPVEFFLARR